MELNLDIIERIQALEEKYSAMGQDMLSYLDGLLHADFLTYWDYIHLDTLLSLQSPKTKFPDEQIFIIYHQITELYFKLIRQAIDQVRFDPDLSANLFKRQLKRANAYFDNLVNSFEIMVEGMDPKEFLQFRMSLLPASGFQSAQYRMIEICSTDFQNLIHHTLRQTVKAEDNVEDNFSKIYWTSGAIELATGKKTLTLRQFEHKYMDELVKLATGAQENNLWKCYQQLDGKKQSDDEMRELLRDFDHKVNVSWPLMHYKSAMRYLDRKPEAIAATGGTNWQKYLPPRFQRVIFYPELLTEQELEQWGRKFK